MKRLRAILVGAGILAFGIAGLQTSRAWAEAETNVNITADEMEVFDAEHQTVFRGNVMAVQTDQQIQADQMTVTNVDVKQDDGSTRSTPDLIDSRGHVTITTKGQVITGEACLFHVRANTMTVTGNVVLTQGKTVVKGQKLELDLKTNHMQMTGGRVQGSFVPK
jgi:lipopolysaccharide export system protein LptA